MVIYLICEEIWCYLYSITAPNRVLVGYCNQHEGLAYYSTHVGAD